MHGIFTCKSVDLLHDMFRVFQLHIACTCWYYFTIALRLLISRIKRIIPKIISPNIIYLSFCYGFYYDLNAFYYENLNFCFFKKRCFVGLYRPRFLLKTALGWEKLRFVYLGNNASESTPKQKVGGSFPFGTPNQTRTEELFLCFRCGFFCIS